jgi:histidine triad (HIT) family protein
MAKKRKHNPKDCIFCQIAAGRIPASVRYEDDKIIAFDDINPNAPIHILVIPKKHISSLADITKRDEKLMGQIVYRCKVLAKELNIADNGYRVVVNVGRWGGQIVPHLHFHLLGGAPLADSLGMAEAKHKTLIKQN